MSRAIHYYFFSVSRCVAFEHKSTVNFNVVVCIEMYSLYTNKQIRLHCINNDKNNLIFTTFYITIEQLHHDNFIIECSTKMFDKGT